MIYNILSPVRRSSVRRIYGGYNININLDNIQYTLHECQNEDTVGELLEKISDQVDIHPGELFILKSDGTKWDISDILKNIQEDLQTDEPIEVYRHHKNHGSQQTFKIYQPTLVTLLNCENSDSIEQLKSKIQDKTGIPSDNIEFGETGEDLRALRENYERNDIPINVI